MTKIFDVNFGKGSYKDRVSGTIPTNSGVLVKRTEKGRAAWFDGAGYLGYAPLSTFSDISICFSFKMVDSSSERTIISNRSTGATGTIPGFFIALRDTGVITFYIDDGNGSHAWLDSISEKDDNRIHYAICEWKQSTQSFNLYINGTLENSGTTAISGLVTDILSSENIFVGERPNLPGRKAIGNINDIIICNQILPTQKREALWQRFLNAQNIEVDPVTNRGTYTGDTPQILNIDGINWNADGVTLAGHIGDFAIGGGTFCCKEDAAGKYIECMTNGTLQYQGINLSEFVGNGYIRRIDGDLSGDAGGTVDAASNVSYSGNVVTLTMTAGQVIRNLTIARDE